MVLLESQIKLKTGDKAPDFELLGVDEKNHSLNDYKDYEGLLVIFMCNHCPYVKAKIDAIKEIHKKFKDKIALIGINSNDPTNYPDDSFENMKKIAQEKDFEFDYLVDPTQKIAKKYGAMCTPDPFLFDKNRKLIFHGRIDNAMKPEDVATEKTMINNIQKFLSGKKIEKDFEPSIGCSIKWKEQT
jgi:peroxiredoxin